MALKPLGWLDKLLALWIILAMALGIVLGATVPSSREVLNKTKFVNVSLPIAIGLLARRRTKDAHAEPLGHDVADSLSGLVHLVAVSKVGRCRRADCLGECSRTARSGPTSASRSS